jgi:hypothetical protein
VTVTGSNLADGTVWFGTSAASGSCIATSCTVTSPPAGVGVVHVRVSTAGGTSERVTADRFTYVGSGSTASTTTVSANPSTATVGTPVTLTAHVTPAAATGQVTFREGGVTLGSAVLSGGTATLTTSSLTVGVHQVAADYLGDDTYAGSTAAPVTVTITDAPDTLPTTTTLEADPTSAHVGETITLTATVDPHAATGAVTFTDDADGVLGDADVVAGVATLDVFLTAGSHHVTASYSGDTGYEPSVSAPATVTVLATQQTTTTLTGPATAQLQSPVTFHATVAPAAAPGHVMFLDETTGLLLGDQNVAGGTASLTTTALGTGQHEVSALFLSSDPAFLPSSSAPITVTITAVTPPPPPPQAVPGVPLQVKAKAGKHKQVTVEWAAPASPGSAPVTTYVVLVYQGSTVTARLDAHGLKLTVKHLKAGKKYRFAVYAVNSVGNGTASPLTKADKDKT